MATLPELLSDAAPALFNQWALLHTSWRLNNGPADGVICVHASWQLCPIRERIAEQLAGRDAELGRITHDAQTTRFHMGAAKREGMSVPKPIEHLIHCPSHRERILSSINKPPSGLRRGVLPAGATEPSLGNMGCSLSATSKKRVEVDTDPGILLVVMAQEITEKLHQAASEGDTALVRQLLAAGVDPDCCDDSKMTALWSTAMVGDIATAQALIERGADVDAFGDSLPTGNTPLLVAAGNGHAAMVRLLLSAGADCDKKDARAKSALEGATERGHAEAAAILRTWDPRAVKRRQRVKEPTYAMNDTAKVEPAVPSSQPAARTKKPDAKLNEHLHTAANRGETQTIQELLDAGAEVDCRDGMGTTPLFTVAMNGDVKSAQLLIEVGADVNAYAEHMPNANTPLLVAVYNGHAAMVRLLLSSGALRDQKDGRSMTPLDYAQSRDAKEVLAVLEAWNATQAEETLMRLVTASPSEVVAGELRIALHEGALMGARPQCLLEAQEALKRVEAAEQWLTSMREAERHAREGTAVRFYFLDARKLRRLGTTLRRLPRLQDLLSSHPDLVVQLPIDMTSALIGDYCHRMCAVSHRWETPDEPDSEGHQLCALQAFLEARQEIEYVWYDFSSVYPQGLELRFLCGVTLFAPLLSRDKFESLRIQMPQRPRTTAEDAEFVEMLGNVNAIYLGMQVLILLDMSYLSRFWTQMEAWMSMQPLPLPRVADREARYTVTPLHNASDGLREELVQLWNGKSAQETHEILGRPDVQVTNQSDKDRQLPKIHQLNQTVAAVLEAYEKRDAPLRQIVEAVVCQKPTELMLAIQMAAQAGMSEVNLRKARDALNALKAPARDALNAFKAPGRDALNALKAQGSISTIL